jgi:hypothetical protein
VGSNGDGYSHFAALNALVDNGWLSDLSALELAVLLIYIRHADNDGIAYPSASRIAKALGHGGASHGVRARSRLVKMRMMERLPDSGDGKGRYRVRIGPRAESALGLKAPSTQGGKRPGGRADSAQRVGRNPPLEQHIEQHIEQPNQQHAGAAGGGGDGHMQEPEKRQKELLDRFGRYEIHSPKVRKEFLATPYLTAAVLDQLASRVGGKGGGILVELIRAEGKAVAALIEEGYGGLHPSDAKMLRQIHRPHRAGEFPQEHRPLPRLGRKS